MKAKERLPVNVSPIGSGGLGKWFSWDPLAGSPVLLVNHHHYATHSWFWKFEKVFFFEIETDSWWSVVLRIAILPFLANHFIQSSPHLSFVPPIAFAPSIDPSQLPTRAPSSQSWFPKNGNFISSEMIRLVNGFAKPTDWPIIQYRENFRPPLPISTLFSLSCNLFETKEGRNGTSLQKRSKSEQGETANPRLPFQRPRGYRGNGEMKYFGGGCVFQVYLL